MNDIGRKVLLVEDEKSVRELLISVFEELSNHQVLSASDGREALRLARADRPDLMLLDVHLPGLNGFEVCRSVKSDPELSHIKVLMLSGMSQNSDRREAQEAGADGYVAKPFNPTELLDRVGGLLGGA